MLTSTAFEVYGIVQGVFFRAYTVDKARSLGLVGWVMNTPKASLLARLLMCCTAAGATPVAAPVAWRLPLAGLPTLPSSSPPGAAGDCAGRGAGGEGGGGADEGEQRLWSFPPASRHRAVGWPLSVGPCTVQALTAVGGSLPSRRRGCPPRDPRTRSSNAATFPTSGSCPSSSTRPSPRGGGDARCRAALVPCPRRPSRRGGDARCVVILKISCQRERQAERQTLLASRWRGKRGGGGGPSQAPRQSRCVPQAAWDRMSGSTHGWGLRNGSRPRRTFAGIAGPALGNGAVPLCTTSSALRIVPGVLQSLN